MAATMKVEGLEELSRKLSNLGERAEEVAARALYAGAGVMADAYAQAVNSIETDKFRYAFNGRKRLPSPEEKAALVGKIGIAKFDKNGAEVNTAVGISGKLGYANIGGKQVAVRKIAYSINSGTEFMVKQPVFRRAATQTRAAASEAIAARADQLIEEITK